MVYDWIDSIQRGLYPPRCQLCAAPGDGGLEICAACAAGLARNHHACARCALPLPAAAPADALCGHCRRAPPPLERARAPFLYAPPLDRLIADLKFRGRLAAGRLLGELLARALAAEDPPRPDLILPVPLHPRRLRERGFNQAGELARVLSRRLGVPWRPGGLIRVRETASQRGLDRGARRRNLRGGFACGALGGASQIALVDDVITTGATMAEAARALRRAGVGRVEAWALARTPESR